MSPLEVWTPAKVNLGLRVLGKRPDGYHEVETILQMVGLYDHLVFTPAARGIEIACTHPGVPLGEENLIRLAWDLLRRRSRIAGGVRVRLDKQIPVGAGLGGGSSDAAATLLALNRLWGSNLTPEALAEMAGELGSDVPFFLGGPRALGRGRGEILEPLAAPDPLTLILVNPGFSLSTAVVYGRLNLELTSPVANITLARSLLGQRDYQALGKSLVNDLEEVVARAHPVIGEIKEKLTSLGAALALMSGSGPTVFGYFPHFTSARIAYRALNQKPEWTSFQVVTLTGREETVRMTESR